MPSFLKEMDGLVPDKLQLRPSSYIKKNIKKKNQFAIYVLSEWNSYIWSLLPILKVTTRSKLMESSVVGIYLSEKGGHADMLTSTWIHKKIL